jgi:hypothetical protein
MIVKGGLISFGKTTAGEEMVTMAVAAFLAKRT